MMREMKKYVTLLLDDIWGELARVCKGAPKMINLSQRGAYMNA